MPRIPSLPSKDSTPHISTEEADVSTAEGWGTEGKRGDPSLCAEEGPTLQEGDLDIVAIHGNPSPMFQLHKAVVRAGQADSD